VDGIRNTVHPWLSQERLLRCTPWLAGAPPRACVLASSHAMLMGRRGPLGRPDGDHTHLQKRRGASAVCPSRGARGRDGGADHDETNTVSVHTSDDDHVGLLVVIEVSVGNFERSLGSSSVNTEHHAKAGAAELDVVVARLSAGQTQC
jgi:hypothetical protein